MHAELFPVVAATAQWLTRAFPAGGGALAAALCEAQARQAVTVAARLRYPTAMDAALVALSGPGGSTRLDWVTGADAATNRPDRVTDDGAHGGACASSAGADGGPYGAVYGGAGGDPCGGADGLPDEQAWRTWVDEVLASWAACLLGDAALAALAVGALGETGSPAGSPAAFRRLLAPDATDSRAAALLRHPDLLAPVADLHRPQLVELLGPGRGPAAGRGPLGA